MKKMINDERIIKYIENELTPEEKINFETDIKNSSLLREKLGKYLSVKKELSNLKEAKLAENYLDSIVPEFRNKLDYPKTTPLKRNLAYASAIMLAFVVSTVILQNVFTENTAVNQVQQFTESLNENQKIELLENLNGNLEGYYQISGNSAEIALANLLQTDFKINYELAEAYDINYPDLVDELSASEAEIIYKEILNKNLSEEVKL
ncbi:MAG: hypothetical protein OEM46_11455 [Ignavibacteria bacterium]|nr:hypothetical protein [Ignavibacteria bacterium]